MTAVYTPSRFLAGEILKRTGVGVRVVESPSYDISCLQGEAKRGKSAGQPKKRTAQMAPEITLEKLENLYEGLTPSAIDKNNVSEEVIIKYV
jgi:hypothetical protein